MNLLDGFLMDFRDRYVISEMRMMSDCGIAGLGCGNSFEKEIRIIE